MPAAPHLTDAEAQHVRVMGRATLEEAAGRLSQQREVGVVHGAQDTLRPFRPGQVTVYALAKTAGRNYSNVHADIARLMDPGLVERTDDETVLVPFDAVEIHMSLAQAA